MARLDYEEGSFSTGVQRGGVLTGSHENVGKSRQAQLLIAECMAEQGFEYLPMTESFDDWQAYEKAYSLRGDEFAEQYGYGISAIRVESCVGNDDPNIRM